MVGRAVRIARPRQTSLAALAETLARTRLAAVALSVRMARHLLLDLLARLAIVREAERAAAAVGLPSRLRLLALLAVPVVRVAAAVAVEGRA